jgi:TniQ
MSNLLFKPSIHQDECLVSYLIRLSENNGFRHIGYLLRYAGFEWKNTRVPIRQILSGEFDLSSYLLQMGLVDVKSPAADVYETFRPVIDTPYIFVKFPKVCLQCLKEYGYCRYQWAFLSVVACNEHQNLLTDTGCSGKKSSWYRTKIDDYESNNKDRILFNEGSSRSSVLQFNEYIEALLFHHSYAFKFPEVLSGLSIRESLTFINFLAHYSARLLDSPFNPIQMTNEALAQRYVAIWDILKNWPVGFYELLSQFIVKPMNKKGVAGINKHFKDLHDHLFRRRDNQGIAIIRKEFDRYISVHWPGSLEIARFKRITFSATNRSFISKKDAAAIIRCRPERIDKFVKSKRLGEVLFKDNVSYRLGEVQNLASLLNENWTISEACDFLQLTRYQLRQLLDAKILISIQRPDGVNRDWVIDRAQSEEFIKNLISNAREKPEDTKSISMQGVQHQGFSFSQLVAAMQSGEVEYGFFKSADHPLSFKQFVNFIILNK